jgi:DNA polymerase-4
MNPSRTIMHIDMDAFFASVEQRCNPRLRGKPIAVIGSAKRTVVTTASYEARRYGVKTGMNKFEAKRLCPPLIFVVGDNRKYIDTSVRILDILKRFSPRIEPYSIDEAFVDVTGTEGLFGPPFDMAVTIKKRLGEGPGLTCSIGIAPNKLLSKLASGMEKPDGLVHIKKEGVRGLLEDLPVEELWGIGPRLTEHLKRMSIRTSGELGRYPASILRRRFGIIGERLKLMGQGVYEDPVTAAGEEDEAKSVGHSMTLPGDLEDRGVIRGHILELSEMVGKRARRYGLKGRKVSLTVRYPDFYTFTKMRTLPEPTNDTRSIYLHARGILDSIRLRSAVRLLGVGICGVVKDYSQVPLFEEDRKRERLLHAVDGINDRFGEFTITWGTILEKTEEPGVISPAWRPVGVKRVEVR